MLAANEGLLTGISGGGTMWAALETAKKAPKVQPWDIQSSALFERLDLFMERCFVLKELCTTATHFQKLESL